MMNKISLDNLTKFFISAIGIVAVCLVFKELQNLFLPFVIAYLLYFLFAPLNRFLTSKRIPLAVAGIIDIAIIFSMTYVAGKFVIDSLMSFQSEFGAYESKLTALIISTAESVGINDPALKDFSLAKALENLDYGTLAGGLVNSTIDLMGYVLFVIFFFAFILPGHNAIYKAIEKRVVAPKKFAIMKRKQNPEVNLPDTDGVDSDDLEKEATKLESTFIRIPQQIQKYVLTKIIMNVMAGITVWFILMLVGVPHPQIWGVLTAILNFIPTIGSAFATILPVLMTLVQTGSIGSALMVLGVMAVVQTFYFNFLEPMILGKRLNLNPLVILISVLVWGYIWGIAGMFLAVPLTAILKIVISNFDSKNMQFIADLMGKPD
jgi:predicted PurR-regulated permease PerM